MQTKIKFLIGGLVTIIMCVAIIVTFVIRQQNKNIAPVTSGRTLLLLFFRK